jgi:hypothetical protein
VRHSKPSPGPESGFTLILLSIVLTVAALLLVSFLPGREAGDINSRSLETLHRIYTIEEAVKSFLLAEGRRPCPAEGTYGVDEAHFGVEAANPGTCTGGTPAAPLGPDAATGNVVAGVVPTKTLGIADELAFDDWGRRITYVVDRRSTDRAKCLNLMKESRTGVGAINILDASGGTAAYAMAAYISHGADGHGAWPSQGSNLAGRINRGSTDADTLNNASVDAGFAVHFDNVFVWKEFTPTFDDLVYYASDRLKNTCCIGANNCIPQGFRFVGNASATQMRISMDGVAVGDINGDGQPDLVVASQPSQWDQPVSVYVLFGMPGGGWLSPVDPAQLDGTNGFAVTGFNDDRQNGGRVVVSDVNGDGIADIIYLNHNGYFTVPNQGVHVIFGHAGAWNAVRDLRVDPLNGANGFYIEPPSWDESYSVNAGDVNGDGISDVIIGISRYLNGGADGEVAVIFGGPGPKTGTGPDTWAGAWPAVFAVASLDGNNGFRASAGAHATSGWYLGDWVSGFDVTGDGIGDLIALRTSDDGGHRSDAYVLFGHTGAWPATIDLDAQMNGTDGTLLLKLAADFWWNDGTPPTVDLNGDGIKDAVFMAPYQHNTYFETSR